MPTLLMDVKCRVIYNAVLRIVPDILYLAFFLFACSPSHCFHIAIGLKGSQDELPQTLALL